MNQIESIQLLRSLADGDDTADDFTTIAPVTAPTIDITTDAPTPKHHDLNPSPAPKNIATPHPSIQITKNAEIAGFIVVAAVVVGLFFGIYSCLNCWKRKRDRRMMELVNTQADTVLGDMCMIPTRYGEDEEDDELL